MGFITEFNWVLKLKPEQGLNESTLELNKTYAFSKKGPRTFPIEIPIDLFNNNWEAVAKVLILETRITREKTEGTYKIIKIYSGEQTAALTQYWRENLEIMNGEKIEDFSKVKVT